MASPERSRSSTLLVLPLLLGAVWIVPSWDFAASGFYGEDDWYFLNLASDVSSGRDGALRRLLEGGGRRLWRPVPGFVWLAEWLAHGLDPRPYYRLNQVVGALLVAGVASLAGRITLATHGRAVGRLHLAMVVAVAGTVAGCATGPHDARTFLAARDDLFAAGFVVLALLTWLREGRAARVLAHVALGLALFSKPTAAAALPLVPALDGVLGRLPRSPRRLAARYGALGLLALAYAGITGSFWLQEAGEASRPSWAPARETLSFVGRQLVYGDAHRHSPTARTALLATIVATSLVAGRRSPRVLAFGALWLLLGAALPVAFYLDDPRAVQGRYILLCSLGGAVGISGLVGPGLPGARGAIRALSTGLLILAMAVAWIGWLQVPLRTPPHQAFVDLPDALIERMADAPDANRVALAVHEVDLGLVALLTSPALPGTVRAMTRPPLFWLDGAAEGHEPDPQPASAEITRRAGPKSVVDLDALVADPTTLVVHDVGPSTPPRYRSLLSLRPPGPARGALPDWHWGKLRAIWGSSVLPSSGEATEQIHPPRGGLASPPVRLQPSEVCGLLLQFDPLPPPAHAPDAWNPLLSRPAYALLSWRTATLQPWQRYAVAPLPRGEDTARFDLRNSPGWRTSDLVTGLALAQVSGEDLELRRVVLEGCE